jgi:hypothetical protein
VKDFWLQAECDDNMIVSHVLVQKITITDKSIAQLLAMEGRKGKRFQSVDDKCVFIRSVVNKEIFSTFTPTKTDYKARELYPNLRVLA